MNRIIRKWARKRATAIAKPSKRVAIMVPLPSLRLNADEEVSLRHLRAFLDGYEKFLLVPEGMEVRMEGFTVVELDRGYFGSAANHNRMLYRIDFWEKFADFDYVLMYHLDALVFSDQLPEWCDRGFDFIGAPFIRCDDSPWVRKERVGNGGFALYRIPSVLKVLWNRYVEKPSVFYADYFWPIIEFQRRMLAPVRAAVPGWMRGRLTDPLRNQVKKLDYIEDNETQNDSFWGDEAIRYLPGFKVAPFEEGLRFAFEVVPRKCLEMNGGRMPFGCHAWGRYDRGFWKEHLLEEASSDSSNPSRTP